MINSDGTDDTMLCIESICGCSKCMYSIKIHICRKEVEEDVEERPSFMNTPRVLADAGHAHCLLEQ